MSIKLLVAYPTPTNADEFDRRYRDEHLPMGRKSMIGATRIVSNRVLGAPMGTPAFHQVTEVHFPSMEVLQQCAGTQACQDTMAHAISISTGGKPDFLIVADDA